MPRLLGDAAAAAAAAGLADAANASLLVFLYIRCKNGTAAWRAASSYCSLPNSADASLFAAMADCCSSI